MMPIISVILLTTILAGLWRVAQGPTSADRVLGIQMSGTTGIALLLVLADLHQHAPLRDVAAVLALLAAGAAAALVQVLRGRSVSPQEKRK